MMRLIFFVLTILCLKGYANPMVDLEVEIKSYQQRIDSLWEQDSELFNVQEEKIRIMDEKSVLQERGQISMRELNVAIIAFNQSVSDIKALREQRALLENDLKEKKALLAQMIYEETLAKLTTREEITDIILNDSQTRVRETRSFPISNRSCDDLNHYKSSMPRMGERGFENAKITREKLFKSCHQSIIIQENELTGFALDLALGEQSINSPKRNILFMFPHRNTQDMKIHISDDYHLGEKKTYETYLYFIPRKSFPYVEFEESENSQIRTYHINTGEVLRFDIIKNTFLDGELQIPLVNKKGFAQVNYSGNGVMIRADKIGADPSLYYGHTKTKNIKLRTVEITHKGKKCILDKKYIWDTPNEKESLPKFLYHTDQDFLDAINPLCNWSLTMEDLEQ